MKSLLKKVRGNKKGFTLAELLVVVAIVGILVAISVPVFTAQLGKARQATNLANMRAAVAQYLTADNKENVTSATYVYDVDNGAIDPDDTTAKTTEVKLDGTGVSKTEIYKSISVTVTGADDAEDDATVTIKVTPTEK